MHILDWQYLTPDQTFCYINEKYITESRPFTFEAKFWPSVPAKELDVPKKMKPARCSGHLLPCIWVHRGCFERSLSPVLKKLQIFLKRHSFEAPTYWFQRRFDGVCQELGTLGPWRIRMQHWKPGTTKPSSSNDFQSTATFPHWSLPAIPQTVAATFLLQLSTFCRCVSFPLRLGQEQLAWITFEAESVWAAILREDLTRGMVNMYG